MTHSSLRTDVADASRILAGLGLVDAFGHVSVRSPDRADRFLMSRSLAPALVGPGDIIELDLDGNCVSHPDAKPFLERFIHAEIYRVRADVGAAVHSHSPEVLPFTVVPAVRVRPICHLCGFLAGTPAPFNIADHVGSGTDLLVRESRTGAALAHHLGDRAVVLMRGHGFTAVGADIAQATFRAIYTALNCRIEREARLLGQPSFLSDAEAVACEATTKGQIGRAWALWRDKWGLHEEGRPA